MGKTCGKEEAAWIGEDGYDYWSVWELILVESSLDTSLSALPTLGSGTDRGVE